MLETLKRCWSCLIFKAADEEFIWFCVSCFSGKNSQPCTGQTRLAFDKLSNRFPFRSDTLPAVSSCVCCTWQLNSHLTFPQLELYINETLCFNTPVFRIQLSSFSLRSLSWRLQPGEHLTCDIVTCDIKTIGDKQLSFSRINHFSSPEKH